MSRGADLKFFIGDDPILTVSEQPVKSIGRWYNASLKDKEQVQLLRKEIISGLQTIDHTPPPAWKIKDLVLVVWASTPDTVAPYNL